MFNSNNGYSLSDIAAATGGNNGNRNCDDMWGGNGAWWIIILFLSCFEAMARWQLVHAMMSQKRFILMKICHQCA